MAAGKKLMARGPDLLELFVSVQENARNRKMVENEYSLGPLDPAIEPTANKLYWQGMAKVWGLDEKQARRRLCANCEYYDNTPGRQQQMEDIPLDEFDTDAGGRGYCVKFDFICHNLRTCEAWEEKPFEGEDEDE
jgi:hypothetical protein